MHKFEMVATGNGYWVADKDGTGRKQVITQGGEIVGAAGRMQSYAILKPEVGAAVVVSAESVAAGAVPAATLVRTTLDYPRNLLYTLVDAASNTLEAVFVTVGTDQFGEAVTETKTVDYSVASTTAGTQIFATITSISITPTNQAVSDTASVGVAIAADVASFGLPDQIQVVGDVKSVNWIDNGTSKVQNIDSTSVSVTRSAFQPEQTVEVVDDYVIHYIVSRA